MLQHLGFQLYLSKKSRDILFPIISDLQKRYDGNMPFEPHLSVHTAIWTELDDAIRVINHVTQSYKKFKVNKIGFGHQDRWSKIFYIHISDDPLITNLHTKIGTDLKDLDERPFTPHISLMYKDELEEEDREKVISNLDIPDEYEIAGIEIVHPGTDDIEWRDYTQWKVLYRKEFE